VGEAERVIQLETPVSSDPDAGSDLHPRRYTGGNTESPTYKDVCTDRTGPCRSGGSGIRPRQVSYEDLLKVSGKPRPHSVKPPGPDWGTPVPLRYLLPYFGAADRRAGVKRNRWRKPPLLQADRDSDRPGSDLLPREDYHQQYLEKRGNGQLPYQGVKVTRQNSKSPVHGVILNTVPNPAFSARRTRCRKDCPPYPESGCYMATAAPPVPVKL